MIEAKYRREDYITLHIQGRRMSGGFSAPVLEYDEAKELLRGLLRAISEMEAAL